MLRDDSRHFADHSFDASIQLDRNAIANARLNGLEDNLHLEGTQYNTCISILFVGYVISAKQPCIKGSF